MPPSVPITQSTDQLETSITPVKSNLSRPLIRKKTTRTPKRTGTKKNGTKKKQPQQQQNEEGTQPLSSSLQASNNSMNMYGGAGMMPYGMSPYYGGMSQMMMGPFSNLNQFLYGIQTVVFSLSQAVQLLGMNQQVLQQSFESLTSMTEHAISTFHELRALEALRNEKETEQQKKRRQRLKTIRWALMVGGSYIVYKLIRKITSKRKQITQRGNHAAAPGSGYSSAMNYGSSYSGSGLYAGGHNMQNSFVGPSMYGGGGYYGPSGGGGYF